MNAILDLHLPSRDENMTCAERTFVVERFYASTSMRLLHNCTPTVSVLPASLPSCPRPFRPAHVSSVLPVSLPSCPCPFRPARVSSVLPTSLPSCPRPFLSFPRKRESRNPHSAIELASTVRGPNHAEVSQYKIHAVKRGNLAQSLFLLQDDESHGSFSCFHHGLLTARPRPSHQGNFCTMSSFAVPLPLREHQETLGKS